ncbi:preprotein translocase subunit YajC [Palleniella muris]|uniref:Preprotein translocase subunit YajC n=1 Tax=Palleniella muris TaxID=3038145 RepID=A0AC61QS94_9BACT|nr:preprotein translocase subunit YajC [Palleniella muris]TGX83048.1 preprotein translocase subunit YajC [Palleniella muris]
MNTILAAQAAGGNNYSMIIMLVLMFAIMYFFMIRPQQKKQKEIRNFQNALETGAKVVTGGGVHGEVKKVDHAAGIVEIEVSKGVTIKVEKSYVFAAAPEQK